MCLMLASMALPSEVCFSVLSSIAFFILSMVSRKGVTICPIFVVLDSANSFWRSFSIASVAPFSCASTLAIVSSKRFCIASTASLCRFSWASITALWLFSFASSDSMQALSFSDRSCMKCSFCSFSFCCISATDLSSSVFSDSFNSSHLLMNVSRSKATLLHSFVICDNCPLR